MQIRLLLVTTSWWNGESNFCLVCRLYRIIFDALFVFQKSTDIQKSDDIAYRGTMSIRLPAALKNVLKFSNESVNPWDFRKF